MHKYALPLILLVTLFAPVSSYAAALDDESIRAFYKEAADAAHDPDKTLEIMQNRLADEFYLQLNISLNLGNGQPHNTSKMLTKTQLIDATRASAQSEKVDKFESNIVNIRYSNDKKFAFVDDTTTTTRTIDVPLSNGKSVPMHATEGEACLDTLALMNDAIKIVKSQCYQKVLVAK